jgi:hypothetical protein
MTLLGKLVGQKMRDAIGATDGWDLGLRRYAERLATEPAGLPSTG